MATDLSKIAKQKKIKYFLISYVDFFGVLRSKLVPSQVIKDMQKEDRRHKKDKMTRLRSRTEKIKKGIPLSSSSSPLGGKNKTRRVKKQAKRPKIADYFKMH